MVVGVVVVSNGVPVNIDVVVVVVSNGVPADIDVVIVHTVDAVANVTVAIVVTGTCFLKFDC